MKSTRISLMLFAMIALTITGFAQEQKKHEISIYGAGGWSTLYYKMDMGTQKNGFGGNAGLSYAYFFTRNWSLGIGAEFSCYNASATFPDGFNASYDVAAADSYLNEDHVFGYGFDAYKEKQSAYYVNIPLMAQYQTSGKHKFYVAFGAKLGIPVKATYKIGDNQLTTSAFFPFDNTTWGGDDPTNLTDYTDMGYGIFDKSYDKKEFETKLSCMASVELGGKWRVCPIFSIYTGVYFDYGFLNIQKESPTQPLATVASDPNNPAATTLQNNSVINSTYGSNNQASVSKIHPASLGLKVKFAFDCGKEAGKKDKADKEVKADKKKKKEEVIVAIVTETITEPVKLEKLIEEQVQEQQTENKTVQESVTVTQPVTKPVQTQTAVAQPVSTTQSAFTTVTIDNYENGVIGLTEAQKQLADKQVADLKKYPDVKILLEGYTCNTGTEEINLKVGLQRAEAVKQYMISHGINASRIRTVSKGEVNPVATNDTPEGKMKNRRVVVIIDK